MKILLIAPLSIGVVNGGVRMQATKTAMHLEKLGAKIDLFNPWKHIDPSTYDVIHLFLAANETLAIANRLKNLNCKLVVSPVFYTRRSSAIIRRSINVESVAGKIVKGIFSDYSIKASVCKSADLVLPNTEAEAVLIRDGFGIPEKQISVIPNGVDLHFAEAKPDLFLTTYGIEKFTLFVGDASARRKNLLNLLKEHTPDDRPLVIIGEFDESYYARHCQDIINRRENVTFLGPLDHDDPLLGSAYAAADVFTLPSQFETPGIAALEAALAGCSIAITEVGGTREVFGKNAEYIDPESKGSIIRAIRNAHDKPAASNLKNHIQTNYSWETVAKQTLNVYKTL